MKKLLTLFFVLLPGLFFANMAEPVEHGTVGARPFTSEHVQVLHENLRIRPDADFRKAWFEVEYQIQSDKAGTQIPLLFYASEFLDSFLVTLDGRPIAVQPIPDALLDQAPSTFPDFSYFFDPDRPVVLKETPSRGMVLQLDDMLYFEVDLSPGPHTIAVQYQAQAWIDSWSWVKEYSFRYALSPASYWKSFGTLNLQVDARSCKLPLSTNIDPPHEGELSGLATWQFESLPAEVLFLEYRPKISALALNLIRIGPMGLALIVGIPLAILHFLLIMRYRRANPNKKISWVMVLGSFLVPLAFIGFWVSSYGIIDSAIGEQATRQHGYASFFIAFLYPIILPFYLGICWGVDRQVKKAVRQTAPE